MRKPLLGISHEFDGSLHSAKSPSLYLQCKREDGSAALFIFTHENRRDSLGPTDAYLAYERTRCGAGSFIFRVAEGREGEGVINEWEERGGEWRE